MQFYFKHSSGEIRFNSFDDPSGRSVDDLFADQAFQNIEKSQLWRLALKQWFRLMAGLLSNIDTLQYPVVFWYLLQASTY